MNIATDDMEKRVNHLRLQTRRNATDHSKIEKRQVTTVHHEQVTRMRICMEEAIFK